jgi:uncharacterized protein
LTAEPIPTIPENLPPEKPPVPWTFRDTWIGLASFIVFMVGVGLSPMLLPDQGLVRTVWVLIYQPLQFIPILVMLRLRGATWANVGFQKAKPNVMALGCGLIIILLGVNLVNNLVMLALGVEVQAEQFSNLLASLDQPAALLITGILFAPLFEETIFRGFLFNGLRQKWGWVTAALVSSAIFAAGHLSIAAFIPTFALGFLFAYLFQKSNSIWPGIILHTLINSVSLCALLTVMQSGIPIGF